MPSGAFCGARASACRATPRPLRASSTREYATGVQVTAAQMKALPLERHDWHGDWNYTLCPRDYDQPPSDPDPFDQPSPDLTPGRATPPA
jgi:Rhodopirellula transposase DDE domain